MNILLSIHTYFAFTSPMSLYGSSLCSPPTPFFSPPFPLFCFLRCVSEHGASNLGMFIRKGSCIKLPNFETRRMHLLNNALRRHPKQAAFMHHFPAITPGSMFSLRITPIYVSLSLVPDRHAGQVPKPFCNHANPQNILLELFNGVVTRPLSCEMCLFKYRFN